MAKITLKQPDGPYSCTIDTGVLETVVEEAFLGVLFKTKEGEMLAVSMRDGGFEVRYSGDFGGTGFNAGWTEFKNGEIKSPEERSR